MQQAVVIAHDGGLVPQPDLYNANRQPAARAWLLTPTANTRPLHLLDPIRTRQARVRADLPLQVAI